MIFDTDFPRVRESFVTHTPQEALQRCSVQEGDEVVVYGIRYVLPELSVTRVMPIGATGRWVFCVTGTFERAEHQHPRLWGVTHV